MMTAASAFAPVAIVGRACVLPGALSPAALWQAVAEGRDLLSPAPTGHWGIRPERAFGPGAEVSIACDRGGYVRGFDAVFDPEGFGLPGADVAGLDPVFQWLLHTGRAALHDAGVPVGAPGRGGIIVGNLSYPTPGLARFAEAVWLGRPPRDARNRFMSGLPALLTARALGLDAPGASFCLDAACASSLYALKLACDRLHDGSADIMLAAGINHSDDLFLHAGFTALRALSPSGASRPFHREADGLIPAEGAVCVVLKRLPDALHDGDTIHGVVRGIGLSNDGRSRGLLVPDADGQERALRRAYAACGLSPEAVSLVECHATGTTVGDATEIDSMGRVFAGLDGVPIGSLKSNLGHSISVAGLAGLLKVLGAMAAGVRPPTLHADDPTPALDASPFRLLTEAEDWPEPPGGRVAAVSAFGFGGNNAHLIVSQTAEPSAPRPVPATRIAVVGLGVASAAPKYGAAGFAAALAAPADAPVGPMREIVLARGLRFPPADMARAMPQQMALMQAVQEAVAACDPLPTEATGVIAGMGCDPGVALSGLRWRAADVAPDVDIDGLGAPLDAALVLGTMPNLVANRLNAQFGWQGPSLTVSAEENSGPVGLALAARALASGDIEAAVVGAVDMACDPVHAAALRAVDPDLRPGDGAVALILMRQEDASAQGRRVRAVIEPTEDTGALLLPDAVTPRLGHAHAAAGLLQVAAAVTCCAGRFHPGGRPWLTAQAVAVAESRDMGGGRARWRVTATAPTPPRIAGAPLLATFAAPDRAAVLARLRAGESGGEGPWRAAVVSPPEHLAETLEAAVAVAEGRRNAAEGVFLGHGEPLGGEVGFVFTGAAASYPGLGRELFRAFPEVGAALAERHPVLATVAEALYAPEAPATMSPFDQLKASVLLCQAHAEVSRGLLGLRADAVMGLSSGETNSLLAAGAWSDMEAMFAEIATSGMYDEHLCGAFRAARTAWGLDDDTPVRWENWRLLAPLEDVRRALTDSGAASRCALTIINAPDDCVIGGAADACKAVIDRLGRDHQGGAQAVHLGHDMIVHCPELAPFAVPWRAIHTRRTTPPAVRCYSNAFGGAYAPSAETIAESLTRQALEPVDFARTILRAWDDGVRVFVEHGPRAILTQAIGRTLGDRPHLAVALDAPGRSPLHHVAEVAGRLFVAGVEVDGAGLAGRLVAAQPHSPGADSLRLPAHLPPVRVRDAGWPMPPAPSLPPVAHLPPLRPVQPPPAQPPQAAAPTGGVSADGAAAFLNDLTHLHRRHVDLATATYRQFLEVVARHIPDAAAADIAVTAPPLPSPPALPETVPTPERPLFDRPQVEILASGRISDVFGPLFTRQDGYARQVRLPQPPLLLLVDRIMSLDGEPGSMTLGRIVTETDVREGSWYLHHGAMPAGIAIESGQADLTLISWLGADFHNQGARVYRLLGCDLTVHEGGMPRPGDTLRYDISVEGHARTGDVRLFFFRYDCHIGDRLFLSVRNGQAGFFSDAELADSGGVLWAAEDDAPVAEAPLAALPKPSTRRAFDAGALRAWAAGDAPACFGPGFELAAAHQRTPTIPGGRMCLIDHVPVFEPHGGPWGRGYLRAELDVPVDAWFYDGHFKNDPCMPGTLMADGAMQAISVFMAAAGFTIGRDGWRFEPAPAQPARFVCRGQMVPDAPHRLVYEVFVEEIHDGPVPMVIAALLCSSDGLKVFHCRRFAVRLVPDWPLGHGAHAVVPAHVTPHIVDGDVRGDLAALLACAWGWPSHAFGSMYQRFDNGQRVARLPGPPYHFMSQVVATTCPSGRPTNGGSVTATYAVEGGDRGMGWYFTDNGGPVMPFCVLTEVMLQPCGWLASYMGFALASDDELAFRNLHGADCVALSEVTPEDREITTRATMTRWSRANGVTLIFFDVEATVDGRPLMRFSTSFGFFAADALSRQVGMPGHGPGRERLTAASEVPAHASAVTGSDPRLPQGRLRMIDAVTGWWPTGGSGGLGAIRGKQAVNPGAWYFKAHFFQDPVQPGSLGLEALIQLLERAALLLGLDGTRFEAPAPGPGFGWKYRGQVVPTAQTVTTELEITSVERDDGGVTLRADGGLWVDGLRIYEVTGLSVRLIAPPPVWDAGPTRAFWRRRLGRPGGAVEDLFLAVAAQYVGEIKVADPLGLERLNGGPALVLANHQVALESLLFAVLSGPLVGRPVVAVAKQEHRDTWMGRLLTLCMDCPDIALPPPLAFFDRADPASMFGLLDRLRHDMDAKGLSLLVHAAGTRSLACGQPVDTVSAAFLDFAVAQGLPIVPLRFHGALPRSPLPDGRLDFPLGHARQDVFLGPVLWPGALAGLPLAQRKSHVLAALNGTGPAIAGEQPNPARPTVAASIEQRMGDQDLALHQAALIQAIADHAPANSPLAGLLDGTARQGGDPWLRRLADWLGV